MEKTKILFINYQQSDFIEKQGKKKDVEKFLKDGYYVKEERNGYWVLVKPVRVIVTVASASCIRAINMKEDICNYYDKKRISQSLVDKFSKDIDEDTVSIFLDSKGNYVLQRC